MVYRTGADSDTAGPGLLNEMLVWGYRSRNLGDARWLAGPNP